MRLYIIILVVTLALILLNNSCNQVGITNPTIEIVDNRNIPRPFTKSTYFLYGKSLDRGEKPILDQLVTEGLKIKNVWIPYSFGDCMAPIINQMILQLENQDSLIYSFGFTSDSTLVSYYCIKSWKHYKFEH